MFRKFAASVLLVFAVFGTACSHYRLGTGVEREFTTIFIAPVDTNAVLPQATATFSTQIREAFIRDGRLRVVNTPAEAEAILTVKLGSMRREAQTKLPTDSGLSRKFGLVLLATATLQDEKGEKVWFADRALRVDRQIFTDDGSAAGASFLEPVQQTQAEFAIVPNLGEELAAQLRSAVLDTW